MEVEEFLWILSTVFVHSLEPKRTIQGLWLDNDTQTVPHWGGNADESVKCDCVWFELISVFLLLFLENRQTENSLRIFKEEICP